jgi:hypothetical protein
MRVRSGCYRPPARGGQGDGDNEREEAERGE